MLDVFEIGHPLPVIQCCASLCFQAGAPCNSQFVEYYNQLIRIGAGGKDLETGALVAGPEYIGSLFRNPGLKTQDLIEMEDGGKPILSPDAQEGS